MDVRKWWIDLVLMRQQPSRYILNFSEMEVESKGDEDPSHVGEEEIGQVGKVESWTSSDTQEGKEPEVAMGGGGRKTGSGQRTVAFHLGEDQLGQVGRDSDVGSETRSDIGEETNNLATNDKQPRKESLGAVVKKEIIGILKPPNPRKELKSFPSLPECFLHDLGLIENIALE